MPCTLQQGLTLTFWTKKFENLPLVPHCAIVSLAFKPTPNTQLYVEIASCLIWKKNNKKKQRTTVQAERA